MCLLRVSYLCHVLCYSYCMCNFFVFHYYTQLSNEQEHSSIAFKYWRMSLTLPLLWRTVFNNLLYMLLRIVLRIESQNWCSSVATSFIHLIDLGTKHIFWALFPKMVKFARTCFEVWVIDSCIYDITNTGLTPLDKMFDKFFLSIILNLVNVTMLSKGFTGAFLHLKIEAVMTSYCNTVMTGRQKQIFFIFRT